MIQTLNDSERDALPRWLVAVNVLAAALSAGAAGLALARPTLLAPGATSPLVTFYVQAYAVRAVPLGAVLVWALLTGRRRALPPLLLVAGLAQVGDAAIGLSRGVPGMVVGSLVGGAIPLLSARWLVSSRRAKRARPRVPAQAPARQS